MDDEVESPEKEAEQLKEEMVNLKKDIEQREREIGRIIGGTIHDMRTPWSISMEGTEAVLDGLFGELNDSQRQVLEMGTRSLRELLKMMNYFMEFYKNMDGVHHPNITKLNLYPVIDQTLQNFWRRERFAKKKFYVGDEEYSGKLEGGVFVDGDEFLTGRVLDNLVSNAAKYSRSRVNVAVSKDEREATVSVSDDGEGIGPSLHDQIFQIYPKIPGRKDGHGLGLYTARRLVEAQGGRIGFESAPFRGSRFYFTLPLNKSD